jgi:hypothetical protein
MEGQGRRVKWEDVPLFSDTFLDTIPGVDAAWTILGIFESAIFVLLVVSLVRLESGATGVLMGPVLLMPPCRPLNWISGRAGSS